VKTALIESKDIFTVLNRQLVN